MQSVAVLVHDAAVLHALDGGAFDYRGQVAVSVDRALSAGYGTVVGESVAQVVADHGVFAFLPLYTTQIV